MEEGFTFRLIYFIPNIVLLLENKLIDSLSCKTKHYIGLLSSNFYFEIFMMATLLSRFYIFTCIYM